MNMWAKPDSLSCFTCKHAVLVLTTVQVKLQWFTNSCRKQLISVVGIFKERPCLSLTASSEHIQKPESPRPAGLGALGAFSSFLLSISSRLLPQSRFKAAVFLSLIKEEMPSCYDGHQFLSFLFVSCFTVALIFSPSLIICSLLRAHPETKSVHSAHSHHRHQLQLTVHRLDM